jgi:hypothetical protein
VTIQAAIDAELPYLRAEAEARMLSRVTIHHATGATTPNADGYDVPAWEVVASDVPFRLGGANAGSSGFRTVTIGTTEVQVAVRIGHFPADTTGLVDGDLIEVTSGENAGAVLRIVESAWQDQATARRVPVIAVQRPEEWA